VSTALDMQHGRWETEFDTYPDFLSHVQQTFQRALTANSGLFITDVGDDLYDLFLAGLPSANRQKYACRACRTFVKRYGGLVAIQADGHTNSAMWSEAEAPKFFTEAIKRVRRTVQNARVTGVFLTDEPVWGQPKTGNWTHLSVNAPKTMLFNGRIKTAAQMMAEKLEDYKTMLTALDELPLAAVRAALPLLLTETLYRSDKVLGVAEWLNDLHEQRNQISQHLYARRDNILWRAVANAPAGYCHPRSSIIGSLLEDIIAGYPVDDVRRRFDAKMHPLHYMRPQAAPSAGNIAHAEKIISQLNAAGALARRYATLDDLQLLWQPAQPAPSVETSVFGHLAPKTKPVTPAMRAFSATLAPIPITAVKFLRTVLPNADALDVYLPRQNTNYIALVTAMFPEAPPIIQWDRADRRNPVSWYVYTDGSPAHQWGLQAETWNRVTAVTLQPSMWYQPDVSSGEGVIFILQDAKDSLGASAGVGLFPEILSADLHPIRATLESYSRTAKISGQAKANACGVMFRNNSGWGRIRVITKSTSIVYQLDRWD
jgi:hypothetical protein